MPYLTLPAADGPITAEILSDDFVEPGVGGEPVPTNATRIVDRLVTYRLPWAESAAFLDALMGHVSHHDDVTVKLEHGEPHAHPAFPELRCTEAKAEGVPTHRAGDPAVMFDYFDYAEVVATYRAKGGASVPATDTQAEATAGPIAPTA